MASKLSFALVVLVAACASARTIISRGPPAPTKGALMARYIVNEAGELFYFRYIKIRYSSFE